MHTNFEFKVQQKAKSDNENEYLDMDDSVMDSQTPSESA